MALSVFINSDRLQVILRSENVHKVRQFSRLLEWCFAKAVFLFRVRNRKSFSLCLVSAVGSAEMTEQFLETEEAVGFQVPGVRLVAPILELLHIIISKYLLRRLPAFKERQRL
jgi:hypothetical protein